MKAPSEKSDDYTQCGCKMRSEADEKAAQAAAPSTAGSIPAAGSAAASAVSTAAACGEGRTERKEAESTSYNCGDDCLNRLLMIECCEEVCSLEHPERCQNRHFSRAAPAKVEAFKVGAWCASIQW